MLIFLIYQYINKDASRNLQMKYSSLIIFSAVNNVYNILLILFFFKKFAHCKITWHTFNYLYICALNEIQITA